MDRHDHAQPDAHLARRDGHHDQRQHLPVAVAPHARERDQREVRAVEHQLEAQQHDERIAPHDHADRAEREDDRRHGQIPADRHVGSRAPTAGRLSGSSSWTREGGCAPAADALEHRAGQRRTSQIERRQGVLALFLLGDAAPATSQHDRADRRDQQQEGGRLEGEQEAGQQQVADVGGRAKRARARRVGGAVGVDRLQAGAEQRDNSSTTSAAPSSVAATRMLGAADAPRPRSCSPSESASPPT